MNLSLEREALMLKEGEQSFNLSASCSLTSAFRNQLIKIHVLRVSGNFPIEPLPLEPSPESILYRDGRGELGTVRRVSSGTVGRRRAAAELKSPASA